MTKDHSIVYLYESARYHDPAIIKYCINQFKSKHTPVGDSTLDKDHSEKSLHDAITNWVGLLADENLLSQLPSSVPQPEVDDEIDAMMTAINQDYLIISENLNSKNEAIKQAWPNAINQLADHLVNTLPNPLDFILDEAKKSNYLQDENFKYELTHLENDMRSHIKNQLCSRTTMLEALDKFPSLKEEFLAVLAKHKELGLSTEESCKIAMTEVIDPILELNASIIISGNYLTYLRLVNQLCVKYFGKRIIS